MFVMIYAVLHGIKGFLPFPPLKTPNFRWSETESPMFELKYDRYPFKVIHYRILVTIRSVSMMAFWWFQLQVWQQSPLSSKLSIMKAFHMKSRSSKIWHFYIAKFVIHATVVLLVTLVILVTLVTFITFVTFHNEFAGI